MDINSKFNHSHTRFGEGDSWREFIKTKEWKKFIGEDEVSIEMRLWTQDSYFNHFFSGVIEQCRQSRFKGDISRFNKIARLISEVNDLEFKDKVDAKRFSCTEEVSKSTQQKVRARSYPKK